MRLLISFLEKLYFHFHYPKCVDNNFHKLTPGDEAGGGFVCSELYFKCQEVLLASSVKVGFGGNILNPVQAFLILSAFLTFPQCVWNRRKRI